MRKILPRVSAFLDDSLEKKYRKAARDFIWQWFFPQETLTFLREAGEIRRYHLHEKQVREALYEAVRKARLTKRVHLAYLPPQLCHSPFAGGL